MTFLRPLLARPAGDPFAQVLLGGEYRQITVGQFCADVAVVAKQLPDGLHVVNLCQSRYAFMVVFFAVITRGQINLLASKRDGETGQRLKNEYLQTTVVSDQMLAPDTVQADLILVLDPGSNGQAESFTPEPETVVAIVFTSGSTGEPQSHTKTWAMFGEWRTVHWRYVPQPPTAPVLLVATVPPWHMYGLEWAMLVPTIAPLVVHCGPDFFPRDVVSAIDEFAGACMLVTTPLHLRALTRAPAPHRRLDLIVSATAPLEQSLVVTAEQHLQSTVLEIYGCSEVGSLAYRLPRQAGSWRFFDCFELRFSAGVVEVLHPYLDGAVALADLFEATGDGGYELLGRASDIVKVGGKRESLAHLNGLLTSIDGVVDGLFFVPEEHDLPASGRLGAVVVAPGLSDRQLRDTLAMRIDPVFLPRPLFRADALPRDATSKLQRAALTQLLVGLSGPTR
jgi:acyl-coenzyme A synthetase/AMP-(fatty) acid ligase